MDKKLFVQAVVKYFVGLLMFSFLLFIPAGTLEYWNAWLLICILFIPILIVGIVLAIKNPELLRKRLNSKEKEKEQKGVIFSGAIMFLLGFVIAGLDFRFKWFVIPSWTSCVAAVIFLLGYILYAEVLRENTYLSRTVEVQENHKVIDTGMYGIVRHPMYLSTILLFLSMPIVLGSVFSFVIFLIYPFIISRRIINEEKILENELKGYKKYKAKVRYRVIPFIW